LIFLVFTGFLVLTSIVFGDSWTTKAGMLNPMSNLLTITVNGKIYAIGGYDDNGLVSRVDGYDPETDTWTQKADIPTQRNNLSIAAVGGKIYVIGGSGERVAGGGIGQMAVLPTVEEYTPDDWGSFAVSSAGKLITKWGAIKIQKWSKLRFGKPIFTKICVSIIVRAYCNMPLLGSISEQMFRIGNSSKRCKT